jgi:hypothetical protein
MIDFMKLLCLVIVIVHISLAQDPMPQRDALPPLPAHGTLDSNLPDGKKQRQMISQADYQQNLEDAAKLIRLPTELKAELENSNQNVVSVQSIKKSIKRTEEIEKLTRGIRNRLKQ